MTFSRQVFLRALALISGVVLFWRLRPSVQEPAQEGDMTFASLESDPFVRVVIYPGIGVARVGNSTHPTDDFYDGPEVDMPLYSLQQQLRDPAGRLKRQAQRFRVYGYRKSGKIEEITVNRQQGVKIDWTVHLANKKASWYRFDVAMDIEESKQAAVPMPLRNASVADRKRLNLIA